MIKLPGIDSIDGITGGHKIASHGKDLVGVTACVNLNISPKIDLGRRLICDRQVSLNFQAAYMDQIMI